MIAGMTLQQGLIISIVLSTSYDYKYGLSSGHDCKIGFRASCDISSHGLVIFIIIFPFCSQLLLGYDCVIE